MLQQAEHARASVLSCSSEPSGPMSLGMPLSLALEFAFPVFETVSAHYPLVHLQLQEGVSGSILEWIKNGRLSLGLAFDNGNLDGLDVTRVLEERLFLVVSPRSPLARRKVMTLAEIEQIELLMPMPGQGVRPRIEHAMVREGLVLSRILGEANSLSLLKQGAAAGVAPTILGWTAVAKEVDEGTLVTIEIVRPTVVRIVTLCHLPSVHNTSAAVKVRDAAIDAIHSTVARSKWRGVRSLSVEEACALAPEGGVKAGVVTASS